MDRTEYNRLLSETSIADTCKFIPVSNGRPNTKGRPPKHYQPLLQKKKNHLESVVYRILAKQVVDKVCSRGSRLAHLYGLLKTHKPQLATRPIQLKLRTAMQWLSGLTRNSNHYHSISTQSPTSSPFPRI